MEMQLILPLAYWPILYVLVDSCQHSYWSTMNSPLNCFNILLDSSLINDTNEMFDVFILYLYEITVYLLLLITL